MQHRFIISILIGIVLAIFASYLIYKATRPCGSDGCFIHLLWIPAIVLLFLSFIIFILTFLKATKKK